ncbi:hypothetical protein BJX61DRAFT_530546 [Aspergillus egyptiacus]|nr:hypothetical protein BJX61DRAFT_530546 [Aspergillus egyptiacus]
MRLSVSTNTYDMYTIPYPRSGPIQTSPPVSSPNGRSHPHSFAHSRLNRRVPTGGDSLRFPPAQPGPWKGPDSQENLEPGTWNWMEFHTRYLIGQDAARAGTSNAASSYDAIHVLAVPVSTYSAAWDNLPPRIFSFFPRGFTYIVLFVVPSRWVSLSRLPDLTLPYLTCPGLYRDHVELRTYVQ